jgi:hypothetical protein
MLDPVKCEHLEVPADQPGRMCLLWSTLFAYFVLLLLTSHGISMGAHFSVFVFLVQ